ncbi:MAG: carboxypeptidase regulatory-like domain-containing protein [Candidatus Zambryskibacteria bacterium]|nr:carboxypeptidase regulatory-like domain-containing protein [Candidatus Zambryskibacteria bacterium]
MEIKNNNKKGFTLVELLVGVSVFTVIVVGVYNAYTAVYKVVSVSRQKIAAIDLANEQLEIVKNLPYAQVGIDGGIPDGLLTAVQTLTRDGNVFNATTTVRNIDDPFDGTLGGTPNDLSPADSKTVEIEIGCVLCRNFKPITITSRVAPKNLETASTNGALFVRVFDANGNPVPQASVHIENNLATTSIVIDDETNNNGLLAIVDAPPGINAYEVTVTKSGYSTDSTYPITVANPNPTKPHATVLLQQVTALSFVIDRKSTLSVRSFADTCATVNNIPLTLKGSKTVGTNPVILKYNTNNTTGGSGTLSLSNMEWDTYALTMTSGTYDLVGANPLISFLLSPNSAQNVDLVVAPKDPNTVLVAVRDSASSLPLADATVQLLSSGGSILATRITGKGSLVQTNWSGGSGQATSTNLTQYFSSNGSVETNSPAGDLKLRYVLGQYESDGVLTSSTYDTGGISNFQEIVWSPMDQATSTGLNSVRFQIATNDDGGTWNYVGPDGTSGTYFTPSNKTINPSQSGKRYLRYKLYLHTDDVTRTPNISDIAFTFTASCTPPGQVVFTGLSNGTYSLLVTKAGYETQTVPLTINSAWKLQDVVLVSQ